MLGARQSGSGTPRPTPSPGSERLTTFTDEEAGFTVQYPESWRAVTGEEGDPQVKFVAGPVGARDYLRVRVIPLATPVTIDAKTPQEDLNALQAQLDKFIDEAPGVTKVHERTRVNVNELPGWYYLYSFRDETSGEEGLHSHFFLFDRDQIDVLVFQALPAEDFRTLSSVFDRILETFRSLRTGSPQPTPTTPAAPPTIAPQPTP